MPMRCCVVDRHLVLAVAVAVIAGCTAPPRKNVDVKPLGEPADRIGVDDIFEVRLYGETELCGAFRVATDGTIDYPLVGRVQVSGLRTGEIQQLLVYKLKDRILKDPQ